MTRLEIEIIQLRAKGKPKDTRPWWEKRFGAFKDDPLYDEAMKAGEEYRKAQVPDYMKDDTSTHVPS